MLMLISPAKTLDFDTPAHTAQYSQPDFLDESKALYEWKYGKQLLYTQILKDKLG